ncbi:MAG: hypothetical protein II893_05425 [Methanomicrobium sp.]|nr:hypothetical protein [Methanomicrobium sp.]
MKIRKIKFSGITVILAVLLIAFLLVAGCTQNAATQTGAQTPAATQATPVTTAPTEQATAATQTTATSDSSDYKVDASFEGSGDGDVSVNLKGGIVRMLKVTQPKYEKASVTVTTGDAIYPFVNELTKEAATSIADAKNADESVADAKYIWAQAFYVPQDIETNFRIETTGDWKIDVDVPLAINAIPPIGFRGAGDSSSPFFQINKGDYTVDVSVEDADSLSISFVSFDGKLYPLDFPKASSDSKEVLPGSIKIPLKIDDSGNYLVNVVCNGKWELNISPAGA